MTTAIGKWGNGAGLRIPQPFMKQLGLSIGDEVKFHVTEKKLVITKFWPNARGTAGTVQSGKSPSGIFLRVSG